MRQMILTAALVGCATAAGAQMAQRPEQCEALGSYGVYRDLCDCSVIDSSLDRLDCYDGLADMGQAIQAELMATADRLADQPGGIEAMRWALERAGDDQQ